MITCSACGTRNSEDAVVCATCQTSLHLGALVGTPVAHDEHHSDSMREEIADMPTVQPGINNVLGTNGQHFTDPLRVAPRLVPGMSIGHDRYLVERIIALGGMGAIYAAQDQHLHRPCAVKEMLDTFTAPKEREQSVEWFRREASMLHDLNHPAIPRVRDYFDDGGRYYLVMDLVNGQNLAEVLDREGQPWLSEMRVRNWAIQLCEVLSYLHHQNVIFRDLKPANVMVGPDERIKLIDFGIARSLRAQNEATVIVTFGFASPEQMQGHPEPRSDLFSLGATLHRLLTHHDPATNTPTVFDFPPIHIFRPDVTFEFQEIIMRSLAIRPSERWTSAGEMGRAIRSLPPLSKPTGGLSSLPQGGKQQGTAKADTQTPSRSLQHNTDISAQINNLLEHGRWQDARKLAQHMVEMMPANAQARKTLGLVYARMRPPDPQRALVEYQEALHLDEQDGEVHRRIGDVYLFILQNPADALQEYSLALRMRPGDFETIRLIGLCYEQTRTFDEARHRYAEVVRMAPHYIPGHMSYGQLGLQLGNLVEAERAFVEALRLNPSLPVARHLLSLVYEQQGRLQDALREAEYAVQVDQNDPDAHATLQRLRRASRNLKPQTHPR